MTIDKMLNAASQDITARAEAGQKDSREIALLLDCYQGYMELLDEIDGQIFDGAMDWGNGVTVKVEGKTIRFDNINQVAEWMTNGL